MAGGGVAAALAPVRQGFRVKVLEQSPQLGEIGAGIQLGPNGFAAFDALGISEIARARAVYTDDMVLMDALDERCVGRNPHRRSISLPICHYICRDSPRRCASQLARRRDGNGQD